MRRTKSMALIAVLLLVLSGVWFLPSVSGQGADKAIPQRVRVLEELVAALSSSVEDLTERVEALEEGQGSGTNSFDVIHLNPLAEFPPSPSDGDICVVLDECDGQDMNNFVCYLNGSWLGLWGCNPNPREE